MTCGWELFFSFSLCDFFLNRQIALSVSTSEEKKKLLDLDLIVCIWEDGFLWEWFCHFSYICHSSNKPQPLTYMSIWIFSKRSFSISFTERTNMDHIFLVLEFYSLCRLNKGRNLNPHWIWHFYGQMRLLCISPENI